MIIELILDAFFGFFELTLRDVVLAPIASIYDLARYIAFIMGQGSTLFRFFFPTQSRAIIVVILTVHLGLTLYYLIMWILRKIPMLHIS